MLINMFSTCLHHVNNTNVTKNLKKEYYSQKYVSIKICISYLQNIKHIKQIMVFLIGISDS